MRPVLILTAIYSSMLLTPVQADNDRAFLAHLSNIKSIGSTIPGNGDVKVFAQIKASSVPGCVGGVGLTTALVALRNGWVIVGSLPTTDGTAATAQAGCLIVLNSRGQPVETFSGNGINGPWDMTALDFGGLAVLFVTNVLNGTVAAHGATVNQGSVLRMLLTVGDGDSDDAAAMPREIARAVIASGFGARSDPAALVIGPTGLGLAPDGTLYVSDTLANRIAAIPGALFRLDNAGAGNTVSQEHAPNGDILTVNAGDGNIVETTVGGSQVEVKNIDTTGAGGGTLFGLAVSPTGNGVFCE
jgi:hypothetical protein